MPIYSLSTLLFPLMFYLLFAVVLNRSADASTHALIARMFVTTFSCYGVIGASLFALGVGIAIERGAGWLEAKRTTPMPPAAYFSAKICTSLVFGLLVVCELLLVGILVGGVRLTPYEGVRLIVALSLGAIPFCAMGLALGYFCSPNTAMAVVNILYFSMSLFSGLWIPIESLPLLMQRIGAALPAYHYAQLSLSQLNAGSVRSSLFHAAVLLGFTLLFLALARVGFRIDEGKVHV